ncbi:lipid kinase [Erwinia sp. V71]|uniref:lipid kinase n=1 Tax=Erwinia sp. V71 TaxID=3369424 RepID=UPI003F5E2671
MTKNNTALLLINKKARKGNTNTTNIRQLCEEQGLAVIEPEYQPGRSISDTIMAYASEVDRVIIGGGDGTLNNAAPALLATQLPLGILPLGTANDLARTLQIPGDIRQAIRLIAAGNTRKIDLGDVNDRLFFNVSSIGFSASLARNLTAESKKKWGTIGYALAAFRILKQSRPFSAIIEHNGVATRVKTVQISVGNGRYYGGGMTVEQNAAPDDGRLDVYSLEISHWWEMLMLFPFLRRGTHGRWRKVRAFSATSLIVDTRRPHLINADGELIGKTPAHFSIRKKCVAVFVP